MNRPAVSVVMPFAGSSAEAREALQALRSLEIATDDELILVDNSGTVADHAGQPPVTVVRATDERSPAYARNVGAAHASNEWILFLDADTRPRPGLLDAFWAEEVDQSIGALAGEIVPTRDAATLAARYGTARSFLGQRAHQRHPYRPRAAAANLLVRRAAFEQLGGFYEGVRAAEDTDFSWRLQEAGWRLGLREQAQVEHRYRPALSELRRQWRGYAAGRAWLARRYDGFVPEPALRRAARRARVRIRGGAGKRAEPGEQGAATQPRSFLALDALLSLEELAGFTLSNRPSGSAPSGRPPAAVVLVADLFPVREDPMAELADSLEYVRVEARGRPLEPDQALARRIAVDYLEDDGLLTRLLVTGRLVLRHPWRCLRDLTRRPSDGLSLSALAPAARRLEHDPEARLHALGPGSRMTAERLARLTGRALE